MNVIIGFYLDMTMHNYYLENNQMKKIIWHLFILCNIYYLF